MNEVLIFILDDDMDEAEEIGVLLHENVFPDCKIITRIFTASISMLQNIDPSARIFIVDYRVDKLNGLEVIEKIKQIVPHCYFIMLSGMRNYEIIEQFDNTVMRGKYITKGKSDTEIRIVKFVREFIADMQLMEAFYAAKDTIDNNIKDIRKIMKGGEK